MKSVPKPLILGLLVALALAAWWYFGRAKSDAAWLGYVEGETVYIAAPVSGRLQSRAVDRGASVALGAALFSLDPETADASVSQAEAQVTANSAQAADLAEAKQRQAEIDVFRANEAGAQAQVVKSQRDFERMSALAARGFASRSQLDSARAARDGAQANLSQARAQIRSSELSAGRSGQILAAQAGIADAQAALRS
ncbi:MAG: biotin/lipoyl-binding protein, partial [Novosphingobium sp.]